MIKRILNLIIPLKPSKDSPYIFVRRSKIHGNGVFAFKDIKKGTKIIQYTGKKLLKRDCKDREDRDERNKTVYLFELNNKYYIDGLDGGSDAIYINHSCDENCEVEIEDNEIWVIALKDIKKGEELFYDYGFDYDVALDHPCRCGSKDCREYIVSEIQHKKLKKLIKKKEEKAKRKVNKKSKRKVKKSSKSSRKKKA